MTLRRFLLTGFLVGISLVTISDALHATHAWGNYHWARTANPFALKLGDNMTGDWKPLLSQASSDWNSPGLVGSTSPLITALVAGTSNKQCRMVAGTTQVCNSKYGRNGWLGLASINISGSHITQGSAKMNDTYFATATYNNPNEKLHVVCQEIAHTFGLSHQSEDGSSQNSCMDYFSNTGANATSTLSTKPNAHDFEQLNLIYSHLDATTTLANGVEQPTRFTDVTHGDPNSWGFLISQSANGRSSTYEKDHGQGNKTITHVFWTLEAVERCPGCDHRYDQ